MPDAEQPGVLQVASLVDPMLVAKSPLSRGVEDAKFLSLALRAYPGHEVVENLDLGLQLVELADGDEPVSMLVRRYTLRKSCPT